jgi:hypothetical protein
MSAREAYGECISREFISISAIVSAVAELKYWRSGTLAAAPAPSSSRRL